MASVVLTGDTSGTITLSAPLVAGSNTATLPAATGTVALTSDVIGVGQTWQNVTGSRVAGTTYTNSTGKPIVVNIATTQAGPGTCVIVVGGVSLGATSIPTVASSHTQNAIVPNNTTYVVTSTNTITAWSELR